MRKTDVLAVVQTRWSSSLSQHVYKRKHFKAANYQRIVFNVCVRGASKANQPYTHKTTTTTLHTTNNNIMMNFRARGLYEGRGDSGAVSKSRWPSWAPVRYGFCGLKATLNNNLGSPSLTIVRTVFVDIKQHLKTK